MESQKDNDTWKTTTTKKNIHIITTKSKWTCIKVKRWNWNIWKKTGGVKAAHRWRWRGSSARRHMPPCRSSSNCIYFTKWGGGGTLLQSNLCLLYKYISTVSEELLNANTHVTLFRSRSPGTWVRNTLGGQRSKVKVSEPPRCVQKKKKGLLRGLNLVCISNCSYITKGRKPRGIQDPSILS